MWSGSMTSRPGAAKVPWKVSVDYGDALDLQQESESGGPHPYLR